MKADVSYNDFKGTVAADISDTLSGYAGDTLKSTGRYFKLDEKRFDIIGLFLNEITMFQEETLPELQDSLGMLKQKFRLNIAIGTLMNHIVRVFRAFSFVILKDYGNRAWFTSDNPVILDKQNNHNWIVPIETEIYLPLSKDFCLFMFNKNSHTQTNHLRQFKINKVNPSDEATHRNISDRILHNDNEFLILPAEIDKTYFDSNEKNGT